MENISINFALLFIFVIFPLAIGGILCAILIPIGVSNKKHRDFVQNNSSSIKHLKQLNDNVFFANYTSKRKFYYRCKYRSEYNNFDMNSFFIKLIKGQFSEWSQIYDRIDYNRKVSSVYFSESKKLFIPINKELCKKNKIRYKKCLSLEKELFQKEIIKPSINIKITLVVSYRSRKGQVDLQKEKWFYYEDLERALIKINRSFMNQNTYSHGLSIEKIKYITKRILASEKNDTNNLSIDENIVLKSELGSYKQIFDYIKREILSENYSATPSVKALCRNVKKFYFDGITKQNSIQTIKIENLTEHLFYGVKLDLSDNHAVKSAKFIYCCFKANAVIERIKDFEETHKVRIIEDEKRLLYYYAKTLFSDKAIVFSASPCVTDDFSSISIISLKELIANFEAYETD